MGEEARASKKFNYAISSMVELLLYFLMGGTRGILIPLKWR